MAVVVKINDRFKNRQIKSFNDIKISSKLDRSASSFQIDYYFNPDNPEHKEFSCIGHYHNCTIDDVYKGKSDRILTGYFLSQAFNDADVDTLSAISGYSLTGFLEDCQVPPGVSLETDNVPLETIVGRFLQPFGLKYVVDSSVSDIMNEPIKDAKMSPGQTVMSHLVELCSQKGIIISNDEFGRLVFRKYVKTKAITYLKRGDLGITRWSLSFNGQGMHSDIWAMAQQDDDESNAAQSPVLKNPLVPIVFRPRVIVQTAGTDVDTTRVAQNALQEDLKSLQVSLEINSWRIDGKIIKPGQIISLFNPKIYLYKKTDFIIDSVDYSLNEKEQIAALTCVVPEVYTGGTPINPFAGINLHA